MPTYSGTQNSYIPGSQAYTAYPGGRPAVAYSNDNLRRSFSIANQLYTLNPKISPFFTYLARMARENTNDPVFKMGESRAQYHRKNFYLDDIGTIASGVAVLKIKTDFGRNGRVINRSTDLFKAPYFMIPGQIIAVGGVTYGGKDGVAYASVTAIGSISTGQANSVVTGNDDIVPITVKFLYFIPRDGTARSNIATCGAGTITVTTGYSLAFSSLSAKLCPGQVIGTAYGEGTGAPAGWHDEISQTEGYCQIFKNANELMSGTAMATEYRFSKNEYARQWESVLNEHKLDIERATLFNIGNPGNLTSGYQTPTSEDLSDPSTLRQTWGIVPYTQLYGVNQSFSYATSAYDDFVDFLASFLAPKNGIVGTSKLALSSRNVITWLNKIGNGNSFLGNTLVADSLKLDITNIPSTFGLGELTRIKTVHGEIFFVEEPLFDGIWENTALMVDLTNVKFRPLVGNGISRDSQIHTNIQATDLDGRKDMVLTEAGLAITLPETHAVLNFS